MKFELIPQIILAGSAVSLGIFFLIKLPVLKKLKDKPSKPLFDWEDFAEKIRKEIIRNNPFKDFSYEIFMQKFLAKARIIFLKLEGRSSAMLQDLRQSVQEKKKRENDDYWEEIQKNSKIKTKKS